MTDPSRKDGPRLRFAPSPTGFFHVGSARTALFNWLVARRSQGAFILRIEDSDASRGRDEWVQGILDALGWLGLDWDEGPYFQSRRIERYGAAASQLAEAGRAYWCECTRDQVDERNRAARRPPGYDGYCRDRHLGPGEGRALRFATPTEGETVVSDLVRGDVVFANDQIDDFVLLRSAGTPLFLVANVVDDMDQTITDVVRGEDHLPNTPKYQLLWQALSERPVPRFAHLPMLVNERRQKLSKRRDPVSLEGYKDDGYLPVAMCNYLALLGWGPEDGEEVLSMAQLVESFSLERVNHSPAFFDLKKLAHFNGVWLRAMAPEEFLDAALPFINSQPWAPNFDPVRFAPMIPLIQERVATLAEVPTMVGFLFSPEVEMDQSAWAKVAGNTASADVLSQAAAAYSTLDWEAASIEAATRALAETLGRPLRQIQAPIRLAVSGKPVGPPLFESMEVLGRAEVLRRIKLASGLLDPQSNC